MEQQWRAHSVTTTYVIDVNEVLFLSIVINFIKASAAFFAAGFFSICVLFASSFPSSSA
jgi:hypothetical protein